MKELLRSAPLFLFVLLLLILSLSVYFGNATKSWANPREGFFGSNREGYIGFNRTGTPINRNIVIPQYSSNKSIVQLYDNIYFDEMNANLLELGPGTGTQISTINVYDRNGNMHGPYDVSNGATVPEAKTPFPAPAYSAFMMNSRLSDTSANVIYVAWNQNTFLHAFDLSANTNVLSAGIYVGNVPSSIRNYAWNGSGLTNPAVAPNTIASLIDSSSTTMTDASDGKVVTLANYDPSNSLIQICKTTYFDTTNGNLVFSDESYSALTVYNRPNGSDPTSKTYSNTGKLTSAENAGPISTTGYYPWTIVHPNGKYLIYYVVNASNTILLPIVRKNGTLKLVGSGYFYDSNGNTQTANPNAGNQDYNDNAGGNNNNNEDWNNQFNNNWNNDKKDNTPNPLSDYYNWLAFWNTVASSDDIANAMKSSNFIPKTAVIPPVCPTCSQCSGGNCSGACTNCGGQGGSGTQTGYRNRFSDFLALYGQGQGLGGGQGGQGYGGGQGGSSDGQRAFQLAEDAGSGTVGLVKDTGKAGLGVLAVGAGLGVGAVQGTVGLAKEAVGGTVGLAKETVGGAVGLAKDAGSGLVSVLKSNPTQLGGQGSESGYGDQNSGELGSAGGTRGQGVGTRGGKGMIDPYSYNGALVSKGGNYIPITTDFSAFGK